MQRYLSFSLRGAIGIHDGIGLDQVDLDLSRLKPGLVAIVGDNGRGKTTLIENLHEYRRMVSYDGKLEDSFFLKDSWRIIKKEIDGDIYEFKILIDGLSGNSEPYIYKNGIILSKELDGKKGPYDKEVIKLFGSEDLYFNTVFAAQKSSGIAKLKPADRRAIFYELLRYIKYEKLCRQQKDICKTEETKLANLEGEVKIIKEDLEILSGTETAINEKRIEEEKLKYAIDETEKTIESTRRDIQDKKIELSKLEEIEKGNDGVQKSIDGKKLEKYNAEREMQADLWGANNDKEQKLIQFDRNNEYAIKIENLNKELEKENDAERLQSSAIKVEKEKVEIEIMSLNDDIHKEAGSIARYEKILENKDLIEQKLQEKKQLTEEINGKLAEEKELMQRVAELQESEKQEKEGLKALQDKTARLSKDVEQAKSKYDLLCKDKEGLERSHNQTMTTINEAIETINKVPCSPEVGASCIFLKRAYENNRIKAEVEKKFAEEAAAIESGIREADEHRTKLGAEYEEAQRVMGEKTADISRKYNGSFTNLKLDREKLSLAIKEIAGKLAEINKSNWEKLQEDAKNAQQQIQLLRNNISNSNKLLEEKKKSLIEYDDKLINIQKTLSDKLHFINEQINTNKHLIQTVREGIKKLYDDRALGVKDKYTPKINSLDEEINILNLKLDKEASQKVKSLKDDIYLKERDLTGLIETINRLRSDILNLQKDIAEKQASLTRLQKNKDTLAAKEAEIQFAQREISDRNFLIRAFDKTGIPVLKLENAGVPITKIANEFLEFFENKFRIAMQTVEWTEDRKKLKEIFDINVIGPNRAADIRKKSGGEQIWVETALQLALIFYQKERGFNIPAIFLDERDGALSAGNAKHFIEMIENAHKRIGVYNTFLITHRQELLEYIPQQIVLEDGKVTVRNEAA